MSPDQAIAIKVRLDTAVMALAAALEIVAACDRGRDKVRVDLDLRLALQLASNSADICNHVISGRCDAKAMPDGHL